MEEQLLKKDISFTKDFKEDPSGHDEKKKILPQVSFYQLQFAFTTKLDIFFIVIACLGSLGCGLSMPMFSFIFGNTLNNLGKVTSKEEYLEKMTTMSLDYIYVGLAILIFSCMNIGMWSVIGKRKSCRIKSEYFKAIMRQEQGWFDQSNAFEFSTKVQAQTKIIENGMGDKVGNSIMSLSMCVASFLIGFLTSWRLSLVICTLLPLIAGGGYWLTSGMQEEEGVNRKQYEQAGGIAEETIYNIKTVASFGNLHYELGRYDDKLAISMNAGIKDGLKTGLGLGFLFFVIYSAYTLSIWYGSYLIFDEIINTITGNPFGPGDVITVLLSVIFGAISLGQAAPNFKAISAAASASSEFFYLFHRVPLTVSGKNLTPNKDQINGNLKFENISFNYPTKTNLVIKNLSFSLKQGEKIAIVGSSGSGKSTIVNLIERLYDPTLGNIYVDDINIKDIDVNYFRSLIGYVSQEPVLFNYSIKENIIFGRENISDEDIIIACKKANAMEIIHQYGLDYIVGVKGSKLSGGQKQRIAIARSILIKPKILILDEATSALDNTSEKEVQKSLESVSEGITTITIAHRLSTIIDCDKIMVLHEGAIVECGSHSELLDIHNGHYKNLFESQLVDIVQPTTDDSESDKDIITTNIQSSSKRINKDSLDASSITKNDKDLSVLINEENKNKEIKNIEDKFYDSSKKRFIGLLSDNKLVCIIAGLVAALSGCVFPGYGLLLSEAITALSSPHDDVTEKSETIAIYFLIYGASAAIISCLQHYSFTFIGETLTRKIRKMIYEKYLRLHIAYFDKTINSPGALLTKLSTDTTRINGIAITVVGIYVQTFVCLVLGITLGFVYCWRLSLVCLAFIPFIISSSIIQHKLMQGFNTTDDKIETEAGSILSESVINTKTIFSYNFQNKIVAHYYELIYRKNASIIKSSIITGFLFGVSQFILYCAFAALYYYGAHLIYDDLINPMDMNRAIFCIIFSCYGLGSVQMYVGDYSKARAALISLYQVIDEKSHIDPFDKSSISSNINQELTGKIEFRNVSFAYDSNLTDIEFSKSKKKPIHIFNNLSFTILPGQKVAFVGPSGSGKSTIIQLLERFYDVTSGQILVDDIDIRSFDLLKLRKNIGLVMQEPVMFKTNIINNIKYGQLLATEEEILDAAKKAYIDNFVLNKEKQSNENVSGGEKQRIAIARAVLKNPKILLLDEATSALDKFSEEIVIKALDQLMEGRTSLVVAHRLSTVVNCNVIFYIEKGKIVEYGDHCDLMALKGKYYNLYLAGGKQNNE